ncbi:MAG: response regulator [Pseudobutyrivibrio sp.]|nr:response regulator [Pseudobutyrivibrio sp.]
MNVFIADDEKIVLEGLKYIVDWNSLGFTICGTAMNGEEALDQILSLSPDIVLMDIRMPKMNGIDVVTNAVKEGFKGKFIILSGVVDFKMAQSAMRNGVEFYLTKPIDEEELEKAIVSIKDDIIEDKHNSNVYEQYKSKARNHILEEILQGTADLDRLDIDELHLNANLYQVISYENYNPNYNYQNWDFEKLIRVTNKDQHSFDVISTGMHHLILLKGDFAINQFKRLVDHYKNLPQKGSPLDSIFISYGRIVSRLSDIPQSYNDVEALTNRRFFCSENQHVLSFESLREKSLPPVLLHRSTSNNFSEKIVNFIQSKNEMQLKATMDELSELMKNASANIKDIKLTLLDIYINVKQRILQQFPNAEIPVPPNTTVILLFEKKYYLYELIDFMWEQFDMMMRIVGISTGSNVLEDIKYYINHNYEQDLKLETIAPIFGYSSSYLGKLFSKDGVNFNSYMDQVRINKAKELLANPELKVYEIAAKVGYKDVNYFHIKFKKYTGTSPAEYRKNL